MDEERRYAEEPEPRWGSGQSPYDSGVHERPDHAFRLPDSRPADAPRYPLTGGVDSLAPSSAYPAAAEGSTYPAAESGVYSDRYRPDDPTTTTGGFQRGAAYPARDGGDPVPAPPRGALDAIRVPLRATEYPAVRPGGATSPGDTGTKLSAPTSAAPAGAGPANAGPAYNEPTSLVPPIGARTGDGPGGDRVAAGRLGGDSVYRTRRPVSAVVFAVLTGLLMVPVVRLLIQATFDDRPLASGIVAAVLLALGLPLTGFGLYGAASAGRAMDRNALLRPPAGYLLVGLVLLVAAGLAAGG